MKKIFLNEYKAKGNDYISDRLQKLYIQINELFKKNDKSKFIIFISNRIVAHFLHPELNKYLSKNNKNKKCKEIIGINKRKSDGGTMLTPSLTMKEMNEIIKQFNEDEFNILIGTSAIEEGLDIQSCNAVLTLVELRTPKSFIQIKGRARKSNSEFIIFTNSAKEGKLKIENFLKIGKKMNELFNNDILKDFRRPNFISKIENFLYNFDIETHAKITLGNISVLYNEIIQQIKNCKIKFDVKNQINKVKSNGKITEFEFNGSVSVSTDLKDILKDFPYNLGNFNSKDEATKMCNFYVLNVLKSNNYLDHHLKFHIDKKF
jgi:superfamily II DNA/RNA helicase